MKRSIIPRRSHSTPLMRACLVCGGVEHVRRDYFGLMELQCPNSRIRLNSYLRDLGREAEKGLGAPIWSLSFAIQITSHMFTLGKKSHPPKCLSQCGLFDSNSCRFSLPLKTNRPPTTRNQDMGLEQQAEETRDVMAVQLVSLWTKQESEFCTKPESLAKAVLDCSLNKKSGTSGGTFKERVTINKSGHSSKNIFFTMQ